MHPWGPQVHKLYNKLGGYTCVRVCIVCVRVHGRHRQTYRHLSSRRWAGVLQPTRQEIMDGFSASSEIGPAMILARRWGRGALLEQPPASLRCSPSLFSLFISLSHPYTPRLRLSWSLRTVLSTDTNIFFTNFFAAVCVFSPCVHRLPRGLQMGFTNTYQDGLPISRRVKNNITHAKNSPFNKSIEIRRVSAASFIQSFLCLQRVSLCWAVYGLKIITEHFHM